MIDFDQIKKIIESCHLNFLIGSGASKPCLATLNQIENLLTELSGREDLGDKKDIIEASIKKFYFDKCIQGNLDITLGEGESLQVTQKNYIDLLQSLNTILCKRRSNLVSRQVNLFTTNMDIFLDWSLESLQFHFNDGFSGRHNPAFGTENFHNTLRKTSTHYEYQSDLPLFNIFKLHGSVNWKLEGDRIFYDYGLSTLRRICDTGIEDGDFLQIEEKINEEWVSLDIDDLAKRIDDKKIKKSDSHSNFLEAYGDLIMINPTKQKFETTTRDLTFYELLRMYSNHLERENSVLFVIGFSFADEHIREITNRVAKSNPTLLIIVFAFNKASKDAIEREIPIRPNIKYIWNEADDVNYSLDEVNTRYFHKIANELENIKTREEKGLAVENEKEQTEIPVEN